MCKQGYEPAPRANKAWATCSFSLALWPSLSLPLSFSLSLSLSLSLSASLPLSLPRLAPVQLLSLKWLQGYLAHKKQPPPVGPP